MTEILLGVVIVALLVERFMLARAHARERTRLTNAVIAKHGGELIAIDRERPAVPPESERVKLARSLDNPLGV